MMTFKRWMVVSHSCRPRNVLDRTCTSTSHSHLQSSQFCSLWLEWILLSAILSFSLTANFHQREQLLHLLDLGGRVVGAAHQHSARAGGGRHRQVGRSQSREGPHQQDVAMFIQQGAYHADCQAHAPVLPRDAAGL